MHKNKQTKNKQIAYTVGSKVCGHMTITYTKGSEVYGHLTVRYNTLYVFVEYPIPDLLSLLL